MDISATTRALREEVMANFNFEDVHALMVWDSAIELELVFKWASSSATKTYV